ncbi:MAG: acylphosphatase [Trueperaceae bacterium]|nr:acylphosphatase [Trueperaceae bacterium]
MSEPSRSRLTVLISGLVQGVGFRAFVRTQALDGGLTGHAENLADGRVEVVAEGPRDELEHFLARLRQGPLHAEVEAVDVQWGEAGGVHGFHTY